MSGKSYDLLERWLVTVDCKLTFDDKDVDWDFNFAVNEKTTFVQIYEVAKSILRERFAKVGWKITKISMVTSY